MFRSAYTLQMVRTLVVASLALWAWSPVVPQIDYATIWAKATPFHLFLENVKARQEQWRSRFANAAIDASAVNDARGLTAGRRILAIAEDRCSDSAWAVPYLAKLAAAVPDKIELRVIGRREGGRIQAEHLTPDGRRATPTIVILDENDRVLGAWVERPAELQKWYIENKPTMSSDDLHESMARWYADDAGRSTITEVLAIMRRTAPEAK
jgi:Thioredoxin